jgi:hypothetical protein
MAVSQTHTANLNYRLISEEIDTILAEVLGKFLVQGSPTKHGGLRFLDIDSAKTFGFERTKVLDDKNLLILSAPAELRLTKAELFDAKKVEETRNAVTARLNEGIHQGPHASAIHEVTVRPSPDPGKAKKLFVEVRFFIPTSEILSDDKVEAYARTKGTDTSEAVRRLLREHIIPMAKSSMDHLIQVVRAEDKHKGK